jgi:hypothetical protein
MARSFALPPVGYNKVAYYAFDATPVDQGILPLTTFTDNANIVVVFEGTLWELADTVHYNSGWMKNVVYKSKKQVLDDIQTLRKRGILVLMNVDDAASWSTATPFTTWNGKALNYTQFASFVDSCVTAAGLDGISLDVEHKAVDNTNYRNLIKEFGKYFGPLSSNPLKKMYTGAFYSGRDGPPGPIFREVALSQYLNFVMDMGYKYDNTTRFNYWAATLGNSKVMIGMSHQDNSQASAVAWASWHPTPEKAGVMVFAANVNKPYTDAIFAALGSTNIQSPPIKRSLPKKTLRLERLKGSIVFHFPINSAALVSFSIVSASGKTYYTSFANSNEPGNRTIHWNYNDIGGNSVSSSLFYAVLDVNGTVSAAPFVLF